MAKKIIKKAVEKKPVGRPFLKYDFELCKEICAKVSEGGNIVTILKSSERYPDPVTFRNWKEANEELITLYTRSVQTKADAVDCLIDETITELKQGKIDPPTARVIIDTLKWKASKYYPKMFGTQQIDITTQGDKVGGNDINIIVHESKD